MRLRRSTSPRRGCHEVCAKDLSLPGESGAAFHAVLALCKNFPRGARRILPRACVPFVVSSSKRAQPNIRRSARFNALQYLETSGILKASQVVLHLNPDLRRKTAPNPTSKSAASWRETEISRYTVD